MVVEDDFFLHLLAGMINKLCLLFIKFVHRDSAKIRKELVSLLVLSVGMMIIFGGNFVLVRLRWIAGVKIKLMSRIGRQEEQHITGRSVIS